MAGSTAAKAAPKPRGEGFFSKIKKFIRESWNETFKKSAWPSPAELRQLTLVVLVALVIVTVWIGGLDFIVGQIVSLIER